MSRRKVRGLTRTGRQVSEDPDLDNLLSNLSPEDLEELEKEVVTAPDLDRNEGKLLDQGDTQSQPATNHNRDVKLLDTQERDTKKLNQRERSFEGEPKKETRKQEYLRKMGLSQEGKEEGIQRQASVSSDQENKMEDRNNKGPGSSEEDRAGTSYRYRRAENKDNEVKEEMKEKERNEDSKLKEKRENRESTSSKTRDMILKLQEKKDDSREKERKEDSRKSVDSKTKELISKLKEKDEKEKDRKEDMKKREDNKTRGLVSKMVEKQSQVQECKTGDKKTKAEKSGLQVERQMSHEKESEGEKKVEKEDVKEKAKEKEAEIKQKENGEENKKTVNEEGIEKKREKEENKGKDTNEGLKSSKSEELGNCVEKKGTPIKKTKEEEEEEEDSSMFDELMEQVRSNDPSMLELNINNSEVIKTKTLIQFAEALHNNSHIKTLALANCRADDHVAYAVAGTLRSNKTITSINLDSNHLTPKGIIALIHALQHNTTLTELRFHNQRHICGGKTEMEMTKVLKDNTTLLKLGYHFELAGPRMTMTNILSRNMDRQRQKRLQEQKLAQANGGDKKGALEVPKTGKGFLRGSPKASPKPSPHPSPMPSPKLTPKRTSGGVPGGGPPPPPPPPGAPPPPPPLAPMLDIDTLRNTLTPVSQRKMGDKEGSQSGGKNSRDQLLASIRAGNKIQLKKVAVPKLLQ